jgi:hypothetical protein
MGGLGCLIGFLLLTRGASERTANHRKIVEIFGRGGTALKADLEVYEYLGMWLFITNCKLSKEGFFWSSELQAFHWQVIVPSGCLQELFSGYGPKSVPFGKIRLR